MGTNKDFNPVINELERQGWTIQRTTQGHYKATPPSKLFKVVHFSASNEPRALANTLRDLKKSGFQWPPLERHEVRAQRAETRGFDQVVIESSPPSLSPVSQPIPVTASEDKMEKLWADLKEAKTNFELFDEQLTERRRKLEEAQRAFTEAEVERDRAAAQLREMKARFDEAFSPPPTGTAATSATASSAAVMTT